jgi:hypothetical protein
LAAHNDSRDLISIGAYVRGTDPVVDSAMDLLPEINAFLRQRPEEVSGFDEAVEQLIAIDPLAESTSTMLEVAHDPDSGTFTEIGEAS